MTQHEQRTARLSVIDGYRYPLAREAASSAAIALYDARH